MIQAILIIGPTGSGKTPLGDALQAQGLRGRKCHHFDFGAQLRKVQEGKVPAGFSEEDVAVVLDSLATGALLENETFYIAEKLLKVFIIRQGAGEDDIIILNGMPRHIGQADDAAAIVEVKAVISLECDAETVYERISLNTGGDRTDRNDDQFQAIQNKLGIYAERTRPLMAWCEGKGIPIERIQIGIDTQPSDILAGLTAV